MARHKGFHYSIFMFLFSSFSRISFFIVHFSCYFRLFWKISTDLFLLPKNIIK